MTVIKCISPVDGTVYAEPEALGFDAAKAVIARARKAQKAWGRRPLEERVQLVMKGFALLNGMAEEVVPEIAWQMGRPVRYGGEFRGFNERANYMASVAAEGLRPYVIEESATFERRIEQEPHGVVLVIAPRNYPYMTAINTCADGGNTVVIKHASQTLLVGERMVRAFVEAVRWRVVARLNGLPPALSPDLGSSSAARIRAMSWTTPISTPRSTP